MIKDYEDEGYLPIDDEFYETCEGVIDAWREDLDCGHDIEDDFFEDLGETLNEVGYDIDDPEVIKEMNRYVAKLSKLIDEFEEFEKNEELKESKKKAIASFKKKAASNKSRVREAWAPSANFDPTIYSEKDLGDTSKLIPENIRNLFKETIKSCNPGLKRIR